ncbi:MAG TPA: cation diffusion facilitator family transporter [Thermoanaerobaculia bacterium]|nr:cation diffusion facilitator family transporter [Thermoanaerobaculia bacterium]
MSPETAANAPVRYAAISVAAAVATIVLKTCAWALTSSVGLLSDALESLVNLAGAVMALYMLRVAARPADEDHAYGHTKAEYFASAFEGSLIVLAAFGIALAAVSRLIHPRPLERLGLGIAVSLAAAAINLIAALIILRGGKRLGSITLEANARHLLTDVWTSAAVLLGIGAVVATGWQPLDPIVALAVAANIVRTGIGIVRRSVLGLMDTALPDEERERLLRAIERHLEGGVQTHALRTRQSGLRRFVSFHVLVPGDWTVRRGHQLLEEIEADVRTALPTATVFTHLEPLDDPAAWEDTGLDRRRGG